MRGRLVWRLYAGYFVLILVTALVVGVLVYQEVRAQALDEARRSLESQGRILGSLARSALVDGSSEGLQETLQDVGRRSGVRLTVIAADGRVLADSDADPARMENHGSRPEIQQAAREGVGHLTRRSATVERDLIYVALPVRSGDRLAGFVRVARPLRDAQEQLARVRVTVALGAGAAAVTGLLIGWFVARRVSRPLRAITRSASAIAGGDYDAVVSASGDDEIGRLAEAFNRMTDHLREQIRTLDRERHQVVAVLASMVEGLIAVDPQERVAHVNAAAARFLGIVSHLTIGQPISDVIRIPAVLEAIGDVMRTGRDVTTEVGLETPQPRILELHGGPLRNEEGRLEGAVLVLHDISELRHLEQVRRDFVTNVSHELKTPLAAVRGLVETMHDHADMDPETRRRFLEKLQAQSSRLSSLVTDLLVLSRVEARGGEDSEAVDLVEVAREAARLLQAPAEAGGLHVDVDVPDEGVIVDGDAEALQQMIGNLLSNALKYTQPGGRIWLRVRAWEDVANIEVQDTGIGIEREHLGRIFERFYRVDKARSRELGGTGLGLSIVKHIAQSMRGNVAVESRPGEGTTFRVTLPLAHDTGEPSTALHE